MILTNRQIVWTPILGPDFLAIALDRKFAEACLGFKPPDVLHIMKRVWKSIEDRPRHMPSNFLDIYRGLLPRTLYLDGGKGLWLQIETGAFDQGAERPVTYHGHNDDLMPDRYLLVSAFAAWANAAFILLDWH